ncbi:MAG TPA: hypothetical protein DCZ12_04400 [Gammaproteobacteria bacterium]|nr:hypothetical protein [Gammaproteobacteria bacterium]
MVLAGGETLSTGLQLAEQLRNAFPDKQIITDCSGNSMKSQFKKADKSGAYYACILGANEVTEGTVSIKSLRVEAEQVTIKQDELAHQLALLFNSTSI